MARSVNKIKKIKLVALLAGLFIAIFCLDLSINANILNVDAAIKTQPTTNPSSIPLSPRVVSLISLGIIAVVLFSRRAVSHDSTPTYQRNKPEPVENNFRWIAPDSHANNSSSIEI